MKTKLAVWLALASLSAFGQTFPTPIGTNVTVTATTAGSTISTNTLNWDFLVVGKELSLGFTFALAAATGTSSNVTVTVQKSPDRTNWVNYATMVQATSGTTTAPYVTNWSVGAYPFFRISTVVNEATQAVNNLIFYKREK